MVEIDFDSFNRAGLASLPPRFLNFRDLSRDVFLECVLLIPVIERRTRR